MNEDNLNMEIRKFLKKVGISSQRIIESSINNAIKEGNVNKGMKIDLEMKLNINSLNIVHIISDKIKID